MNKKVEIIIETRDEKGNPFAFEDGMKFTSVGFSASTYGAGTPCKTDDEIRSSIEHQKQRIIREGDIPVVIDKRQIQLTLMEVPP